MVLDGIEAARFSERELARALGTDPEIGTRQRVLDRFVRGLGLDAFTRHSDTRLAEISEAMRSGHVVIVCYWLAVEETDHYAVVTRLTREAIVLHDPWEGPETVMAAESFEQDWLGDDAVAGRRDRWMLAIRVPES